MIEHLSIKNVTIIEELEISFCKGLNIISGETGAGKSIIIDSLGFILGNKANKDFIRRGCDSALVEGLFYINSDKTLNTLKGIGIDIDNDRSILISRNLSLNGKNHLRINGKLYTLAMLKEISPLLVDIHGQHENQLLLNPTKHIILLDRFCGDKIDGYKDELLSLIKAYKETLFKINSISNKDTEDKITKLNYNIEEIENSMLKPDEEEHLQQRKKILISHKTLALDTNKAIDLLYGTNEETGAIDKILNAIKLVTNISYLDKSKLPLVENLEAASIQLDDVIRQLRQYDTQYDPNELLEIETRLDHIYNLKRKYGNNIEEILNYNKKMRLELDLILENLKLMDKLKEDKKILQNKIIKKCNEISYLRKETAESLQTQIESNLKELGMKNAIFKINIDKVNEFNNNGNDKVEFLISTNLGEPLKGIYKIASGGEMSRVMLALKVVMSNIYNIDTFIFDEIDTGVSGRTAQKVAEKLAIISKNKQILCITHLPQIAAMGDKHFLIEKSYTNGKTLTNITNLNNKLIIEELARLIGGAKITETTITAAHEMKEMAQMLKNNI